MGTLHRRDALKQTAALLGATVAGGATWSLSGCAREPPPEDPPLPSPSFQPEHFTVLQALIVQAVAERIIPEDDRPGATSAGVPAFIERMVHHVYRPDERDRFIAGIAKLYEACLVDHGLPYWACPPDIQTERLHRLAAQAQNSRHEWSQTGAAPFFIQVRELTIQGFCTSEAGATRVMAYTPTPGPFQGCVPLEQIGRAWATG